MNNWKILLLFLMFFPGLIFGQKKKIFQIKYISSENVYLNGGKADGLQLGDTLAVKRGKTLIAAIKVHFISEHSASCAILKSRQRIATSDYAVLLSKRAAEKQKSDEHSKTKRHRLFENKKSREGGKKKTFAKLRGSISLQWFHLEDMKYSRFNFDQPTLRINLKLKNIAGKKYNLRIRTRSRYYQRSRNYSSRLRTKDWQNRIYQISFSYDDENAFMNYKIGRIISNKFSGVGYIDGALLQTNLNENLHIGVFAGTQPEWRYSGFQSTLQKYGSYLNLIKGDYQKFRFETTWAVAGEYHGSTVSREFLYFQNNFYASRKFSLYQSAEIDINRQWRKERTGKNLSLTNLYLSLNINLTNNISTSLSYDNRKNYWTYEIQSLVDSLFDDAFRHGFRAQANIRLKKRYFLFANIGTRKRQSDSRSTYSYSTGLNANNLFDERIYLNFRFTGFVNYYASGINPAVVLGKNFSRGHNFSVSYGNYSYKLESSSSNRKNQWLRFDGYFELWNNFYLFTQYEYDWGSDNLDHRIIGELGYRF